MQEVAKKPKVIDSHTPFKGSITQGIGQGKTHSVRRLEGHPDIVVKVPRKEQGQSLAFIENSITYKKKKYELLQHFLGRFIPHTTFAIGPKTGLQDKTGYSFQQAVPDVKISDVLKPGIPPDPRLIRNLQELLKRLITMHQAVRAVNAQVGASSRIDVTLDLGPISQAIHHARDLNNIDLSTLDLTSIKSPNLLVDPKTMDLYCIDFDEGTWNNGKEATRMTLMSLYRKVKN